MAIVIAPNQECTFPVRDSHTSATSQAARRARSQSTLAVPCRETCAARSPGASGVYALRLLLDSVDIAVHGACPDLNRMWLSAVRQVNSPAAVRWDALPRSSCRSSSIQVVSIIAENDRARAPKGLLRGSIMAMRRWRRDDRERGHAGVPGCGISGDAWVRGTLARTRLLWNNFA